MQLCEQRAGSGANKRYLEEQLAGLTPIQLLIKVYDAGIIGCAQKNHERVSRALVELIASLNFQHREVAGSLFRLYDFCLRETKKSNFDAVSAVLCDLRDTWRHAETRKAG